MAKLKKKTSNAFKLFQKKRQPTASKKGQSDAADAARSSTEDGEAGISADPNHAKAKIPSSSPTQEAGTPGGKKKKLGRWFGIKGKHHKKPQPPSTDSNNETFMTADTEDANDENSELKQIALELFPGLRDEAPAELDEVPLRNSSDHADGSNYLESWKEFVCDDANPEGVETSLKRKSFTYESIDTGLDTGIFPVGSSDDTFTGLNLIPFDDSEIAKTSPTTGVVKPEPLKVPNSVEFDSESQDCGAGVQAPFQTIMDAPFFPAEFPPFEETTEIAGFLSADQEKSLGTPAGTPSRASVQSKPSGNPAVLALRSLADIHDDDGASDEAASRSIVINRTPTDVSSLEGGRFAYGEDPEDSHGPAENAASDSFTYGGDTDVDEEEEDIREEELPMEPSIETHIALPSQVSYSVASESQAESVSFPLSIGELPEIIDLKKRVPDNDPKLIELASPESALTSFISPPPPPPPPPSLKSQKREVRFDFLPVRSEPITMDTKKKFEEPCERSVGSATTAETSGVSVKTENNFLHHHKKNASPYSWSAIKSGVTIRSLSDEAPLGASGSYINDRFEVSSEEAVNRGTPNVDELEQILSAKDANVTAGEALAYATSTGFETATEFETAASSTGYEAEALFASYSEDNNTIEGYTRGDGSVEEGTTDPPQDMDRDETQEPTALGTAKESERKKEDLVDVAASKTKHSHSDKEVGKSQGSKRSRLVKRALKNLTSGGSQLDAIPEQTAYSDIITPVKQNYRKLCNKFIQHAKTDRKGEQTKTEHTADGSDNENGVEDNPESSLGEIPMLAPQNPACDTIEPNAAEVAKLSYRKLSPQITHQHIAERKQARHETPQKTPKKVHFMSDYVSSEDDGGYNEPPPISTGALANLNHIPAYPSPARRNNKYTDEGRFETDDDAKSQEDVDEIDTANGATEENEDDTTGEAEVEGVIEAGHSFEAADDDNTLESTPLNPTRDFHQATDEGSVSEAEETQDSLTDFHLRQRAKEMANSRKKGRNARRGSGCSVEHDIKIPGLPFLDMATLDRFASNLDCSYFSAQGEDQGESDEEIESGFNLYDEDYDSILSSYDEGAFGSFDSRDGPKRGLENEVEEALKWADKKLFFCGKENR